MEKPVSYTKEYKEYYKGQGWGCGYVDIPLGHHFCILEDLDEIYSTVPLGLDIASWQDSDKLTIGFDTRHLHDETHCDKAWVEARTMELLAFVKGFGEIQARTALDVWTTGRQLEIKRERENMIKEYNLKLQE